MDQAELNGPNNPHEQATTGSGTAPAPDKGDSNAPPQKPKGSGVPKPTPANGVNNPHEQ